MYSTKTATVSNEEFVSNYMPVGKNDNVTLKEVNEIEAKESNLDVDALIKFIHYGK